MSRSRMAWLVLLGLSLGCAVPEAPLLQLESRASTSTTGSSSSGSGLATSSGSSTGGTTGPSSSAGAGTGTGSGTTTGGSGVSTTGSPVLPACTVAGGGNTSGGRFTCDLGDGGLFGAPSIVVTGIAGVPAFGGDDVSLAVGDLNGDGALDLVESDWATGDLVAVVGNGDGTFRSAVHGSVGLYPFALSITCAGDPPRQSLVVSGVTTDYASENGPSVATLDDAGTLTAAPLLSGPFWPQDTIATDLNGDGLTDFVCEGFSRGLGGIDVFLGNADGGWDPGALVTEDEAVMSYVGDFNDDGIPDIVVLPSDGLTIFLGNGDGTFSDAGIATGVPANIWFWRLGDLNEDGHLDILIGGYNAPDSILLGRGDGTFSAGPSPSFAYLNTIAAYPEALRDLNGDGHLDYLGVDYPGNQVHVALGNGDGTFQPEMLFPIPSEGDGGASFDNIVVVGDVDGDGRPDLIIADYADGNVSILLNQCR